MHFSIHYVTEYHYTGPVTDNLNALRVRPMTTATQRCDEFHVRTDPESRLGRHVDYFNTEVIEFGISQPHSALTIDVRARVVTSEAAEPPAPAWETLASSSYREAAGEYLLPSIAEPPNGVLTEFEQASRGEGPLETAEGVCALIPERFEYRRGVTYVGSTVADLLEAGGSARDGRSPGRRRLPPRAGRRRSSRHRSRHGGTRTGRGSARRSAAPWPAARRRGWC